MISTIDFFSCSDWNNIGGIRGNYKYCGICTVLNVYKPPSLSPIYLDSVRYVYQCVLEAVQLIKF